MNSYLNRKIDKSYLTCFLLCSGISSCAFHIQPLCPFCFQETMGQPEIFVAFNNDSFTVLS